MYSYEYLTFIEFPIGPANKYEVYPEDDLTTLRIDTNPKLFYVVDAEYANAHLKETK